MLSSVQSEKCLPATTALSMALCVKLRHTGPTVLSWGYCHGSTARMNSTALVRPKKCTSTIPSARERRSWMLNSIYECLFSGSVSRSDRRSVTNECACVHANTCILVPEEWGPIKLGGSDIITFITDANAQYDSGYLFCPNRDLNHQRSRFA